MSQEASQKRLEEVSRVTTLYPYIGPTHLEELRREGDCVSLVEPSDLEAWVLRQLPPNQRQGLVTATFIVDAVSRIWVADRRSEHVACADGGPVLAAGEMGFHIDRRGIEVVEITNQSTGFCPEPDCWPVVAEALNQLGVPHPEEWTHAFAFRRCVNCWNIQLVKDGFFECGVCGNPLPDSWNLRPSK